jgi:hypothetical protein
LNIRKIALYGGLPLVGIIVGAGIGASGNAEGEDAARTVTVAAGDPASQTVTVTEGADAAPQTVTVEAEPVTETVEAPAPDPVTVVETVVKEKVKTVVRAPKPKAGFPGDGVFIVGEDIQPGRYRTTAANSGNCYWARLADLDGDLDSIVANANTSGPTVVNIAKSDVAFESSGCNDWTKG